MRNVTDVSRKKFKMRIKRGDEEKTPFRAGGIQEFGGDRSINRGREVTWDRRGKLQKRKDEVNKLGMMLWVRNGFSSKCPW